MEALTGPRDISVAVPDRLCKCRYGARIVGGGFTPLGAGSGIPVSRTTAPRSSPAGEWSRVRPLPTCSSEDSWKQAVNAWSSTRPSRRRRSFHRKGCRLRDAFTPSSRFIHCRQAGVYTAAKQAFGDVDPRVTVRIPLVVHFKGTYAIRVVEGTVFGSNLLIVVLVAAVGGLL